MSYVGIDPGKRGGLAFIGSNVASACAMPLAADGQVSARQVAGWVLCRYATFVVVEGQHPFPGQGVVSVGTLMYGLGRITGALEVAGIPYELVPPQRWQAMFGIRRRKGQPKGATKAQSLAIAGRMFPGVELGGKDGLADALLIAEYCRRTYGQKGTTDADASGNATEP